MTSMLPTQRQGGFSPIDNIQAPAPQRAPRTYSPERRFMVGAALAGQQQRRPSDGTGFGPHPPRAPVWSNMSMPDEGGMSPDPRGGWSPRDRKQAYADAYGGMQQQPARTYAGSRYQTRYY